MYNSMKTRHRVKSSSQPSSSNTTQASQILRSSISSQVSTPKTPKISLSRRAMTSSSKSSPNQNPISVISNSNIVSALLKSDREKIPKLLAKSSGVSYILDPISKMPKSSSPDLYEALGIISDFDLSDSEQPKPMHRSTLSIPNLKTSENKYSSPEKFEFGAPAGRKDVELLAEWVDRMLLKLAEETAEPEKMLEETNRIYTTCINEIIRQITVQCKERGELITTIWKAYQNVFERALRISQAKLMLTNEEHMNDKVRLQNHYKEQIAQMERLIEKLNENVEQLHRDIKFKDDTIMVKTFREERLTTTLQTIQEHYKAIKKEILIIKEDNRILSAKLNSTNAKFKTDNKGNIILENHKKIKPKDEGFIIRQLTKDPVLTPINVIIERENLADEITYNENQEEDVFKQEDYRDKGIDAPVIKTANELLQTDVVDLCGESIGVKARKKKAESVVESDKESIGDIRLQEFVNLLDKAEKEEIDEFMVFKKLEEKDEIDIADLKRKHNHVKQVVYNVKEDIYKEMNYQNMPHSPLLSSLYKGLSQALKILVKHPLENIPGFDDSSVVEDDATFKKKQKMLQTIIGNEEDKKDKNPYEEETLSIIKKVSTTPIFKLKKVMFKKMLLKLITQFYDERIQTKSKKEEFGAFVFTVLMKKYVMKKAAENRFNHLLSSCMKYRTITRVRVFGRFLGLYDSFDGGDLEFFLEALSSLNNSPSGKNIPNQENSEKHFVPFVRCVEIMKLYEKFFSKEDFTDIKAKLESLKSHDTTGFNRHGIIEIDAFLEILVDAYRIHKNQALNFVKIIYEAADLNEDGYLQYQEFDLLLKHISARPYSVSLARQLFDAYAETFLSEEEEEVRAISFENLAELNTKLRIFSGESLYKISHVSSPEEAAEKIQQCEDTLEENFIEILWRFSECESWNQYQEEVQHLLEAIKMKIYSRSNPYPVWLAYRIIEEESKRAIVHERLKSFIPALGNLFEF
ncbi:unnamed protein product [Blepharisma stoltei]|uniref:EF-hand domain-containing protein n=1 Tax=Blepharisma stoltei TaxID=1481888 RepID=A0AAU9IZ27_9CILI|nr:unnamed protein product [Blepharisma stoltei]